MLAEVAEDDLRAEELARRPREKNLPAMPARADTSGEMDVLSDVSLLCQERRAGMQADAQIDTTWSQLIRDRLSGRCRARR